MQVICLEDKAFYALIDEVVARLKETQGQDLDKWVSGEQAMQLLNVKSKTTLQTLRDEGKNPVFPAAEKNHSLRPGFDQQLS